MWIQTENDQASHGYFKAVFKQKFVGYTWHLNESISFWNQMFCDKTTPVDDSVLLNITLHLCYVIVVGMVDERKRKYHPLHHKN